MAKITYSGSRQELGLKVQDVLADGVKVAELAQNRSRVWGLFDLEGRNIAQGSEKVREAVAKLAEGITITRTPGRYEERSATGEILALRTLVADPDEIVE